MTDKMVIIRIMNTEGDRESGVGRFRTEFNGKCLKENNYNLMIMVMTVKNWGAILFIKKFC